jgi:CDP-diacylglycerol--glycerol-3-phosphate 3-phosphatidyltransferase
MASPLIRHLPNLISSMRILMAPVLLYLAVEQQPVIFLAVIIFTTFTDVLDGFLARTLNQITELGARLDSWGDFTIYSTMAISAWILWPDIVIQELVYVLMIVVSFTLPVMIGLIKFRTLTSYHTWSVKIAVVITVIGYLLLFSGMMSWPFKLAAMCCIYAAIEQIMITLVTRHENVVDIRTLWQAIRENKIQVR